MSKPMNYVFFFADQQRAESVSCYGNNLVQMPNFDHLANQGVRFEQCHTQAPLCAPARCSLMTGWHPHVMGHRSLWHLLRPGEPSMFKYLRDAGYHVAMYGKNDVFAESYLPLALDEYASPGGGNTGGNAFEFGQDGYYSFLDKPFPRGLHETQDMQCVQKAIDFIKSRRAEDKPFMVFLPLLLPHPPYGVPEPFYSMYDPDEMPDLRPMDGENQPTFRRLVRQYRGLDKMDEGFFKKIHAIYLGMNSYVDWMLGQLMDALDASPVADNTTLIASSDHGDFTGDYGLVEKLQVAFYDVMTRVPLLIRAPGCTAGHVVREPVELMDVMPTVLELSGIEATHTHFAHSLCPQLAGAAGDPERAVFAENGFNASETHCLLPNSRNPHIIDPKAIYYPQAKLFMDHPASIGRTVMMRTMTHKLIWRPDDVSEMYDLEKDPLETMNLFGRPDCTAVQKQLTEQMLNWLVRTSDVVPFDLDSRNFPKESDRLE